MDENFSDFSKTDDYQANLCKVREAILEEIRKALNNLFMIHTVYPVLKEISGDIDYQAFIEKLRPRLEEEAPFGLLWAHPEEKQSSSKIVTESLCDELPKKFYLFFSLDYNAPKDLAGIGEHLLWLYLSYKANVDPLTDMFLSLALCKLTGNVNKIVTTFIMKAERELRRTKKSATTQKNKAQKKKEYIVQILPHLKNKVTEERKTLSTMALAIQNDWKDFPPKDEDIKKPPGLTLISETLKESGEFEQIGGLWILKM
ncbi:MAG: hypothetical protein ACYC6G_19505 [Desulfobaccales bacterium]